MSVATGLAARMSSESTVRRGSGRVRRKLANNLTAYLMLAGGLICFALFSWYPIVRAFVLAFQKTNFVGVSHWVGWADFHRLFADPEFVAA